MKKLFKKLALMVVVLLTFSVGSNYTVKEVKAADAVTTTYKFSDYTAGTQYASNEEHVMDNKLIIYTTDCHFTTQLRIYSSNSNNGFAVLKSTNYINKLSFNAGYKVDVLNVYGSTDGESWTLIEGVSITATSYKDYDVSSDFSTKNYTHLKLDVAGTSQVRLISVTLTYGDTAVLSNEQKIKNYSTEASLAFDYTYENEFVPSNYTLVTDVKELNAGDSIVISSTEELCFALSTNQKSNNRGASAITKNEDSTIKISADTQVITLETGNIENTFAFNVGSGYLYAASSTNNYLKTENKLSDNSSWTIEINESGVATIIASGENTKNILRFNSSSSLFSCYASGQNDVCIYKALSVAEEKVFKSFDNVSILFGATIDNTLFTSYSSVKAGLKITSGEVSSEFSIDINSESGFSVGMILEIVPNDSILVDSEVKERLKTEFTASIFYVLNETTTIYLLEKTVSVQSMIETYTTDERYTSNENVKAQEDALLALKAFIVSA